MISNIVVLQPRLMHLSISPRVGGWGYPWETDSARFSLGRDFDTWALPLGQEFEMAAVLEGQEILLYHAVLEFFSP